MDPVTELGIKHACAELITRYAMAANDWDLDAFVALFEEDGVWWRPASGELRGRAAIRAVMESLPDPKDHVMRHVTGGHLVEVVDENNATAWSQTTVYVAPFTTTLPAAAARPEMVVEYRDRLIRRDNRWLIARRDTTIVFQAEARAG
jgi:uncharacterized protein (TIGR02246 family)